MTPPPTEITKPPTTAKGPLSNMALPQHRAGTSLDDTIPAAAAPPPDSPPGPFSIGSPLFNMGLVAMLMAISFLAVALPARSDTVDTTSGEAPETLAFADIVGAAEDSADDGQLPLAEAPPSTIDNELMAELLEELRKDDSPTLAGDDDIDAETTDVESTNESSESRGGVATPPAAPPQDVVQVVYRTEQIPVPVTAAPATATTTTTPPLPQCDDFETRPEAQVVFDADPDGLAHFDGDGDGRACEQLVDPDEQARITCELFESQLDAQAIFDTDPIGLSYLDGDGDGQPCEQLPGGPILGPELPPAAQVLSVSAVREQQSVFGMHTREAPWWMGELDYVTRLVGKAPNNLLFFSNWSTPFPAEQVQTSWGRGMTPQIAWEPVIPGADSQPTLRSIADGDWDFYIDEWAAAAAAHGQPIVLRLASEMNGNWYSWSEEANGNQEGDFIDMWRHVHGRFDAAGADNVVWLWSVNRSDNLKTDIATYWPGEEYTDWVGISGYWRGLQGAPEPTFDAIFSKTLGELRALTAKPILLAEIGAGTNVDSDRVGWLNTVFAGLSANPDIIGFVYFNDVKAGGDWRIQFSQGMVDAFAAGVSDDRWESGSLPVGMKIGDRLSVPAHTDPNNQGLAE